MLTETKLMDIYLQILESYPKYNLPLKEYGRGGRHNSRAVSLGYLTKEDPLEYRIIDGLELLFKEIERRPKHLEVSFIDAKTLCREIPFPGYTEFVLFIGPVALAGYPAYGAIKYELMLAYELNEG